MAANCKTTISLLADFLDGALAPEIEAALRAHFASCPKCVEFLESYRGTSRVVRQATDVTIAAEVEARLLRFLERECG